MQAVHLETTVVSFTNDGLSNAGIQLIPGESMDIRRNLNYSITHARSYDSPEVSLHHV